MSSLGCPCAAGSGRERGGAQRERAHAADGGRLGRSLRRGKDPARVRGGYQHPLQRVQGTVICQSFQMKL